MNLYIRLLWALARSWRQPAMPLSGEVRRTFRVWPNDLDFNMHMNNGRYLTILDLMMIEFFARTGLAKVLWQQGWRPMSGGAIITYRRGLTPFQRYTIRFRWTGQDAYWNFMAFEFVDRTGKICAAGFMKGAAVAAEGLVPNDRTRALLSKDIPVVTLPDAVTHWIAAEKAVMAGTKAA